MESAIVSCCDAFNAMTTDRSYRAAMSLDEAIEELRQRRQQFSPDVVQALMRVLRRTRSRPGPAARVWWRPPRRVRCGRPL